MNQNPDIFATTNCLSDEQLLRYVKGNMDATEKRTTELHLADCELCSDAVDGLMLVNTERLKTIPSELNAAIDERVNRSAKVIPFFRKNYSAWISAAALLVVSVGLYVVVQMQNNKETLSDLKQDNTKAPAAILKNNDAMSAATAEQKVIQPDVKAEQKQQGAINANGKQQVMQLDDTKEVAEETINREFKIKDAEADNSTTVTGAATEAQPSVTFSSQSGNYKSPSLADSIIVAEDLRTKNVDALSDKSLKEVQIVSNKSKAVSGKKSMDAAPPSQGFAADEKREEPLDINAFSNAVSLYNEKKYSEAKSKFGVLLQTQPSQLASNYYAGMCRYYLDDYKNAVLFLEKSTANKATEFYESAMYHKALCYVQLKDNKKAKKVLESVVKLNGIYKNQAEDVLKDL